MLHIIMSYNLPFILLGVIVAGICSAIKIVPQSKKYIIERLGKYNCTWDAGLHIMVPLIDRIVNRVSLKEQVFDFPPQPMITHDNVIVSIDFVVFCRVFDPKLFSYGVENAVLGMQNISATTLRNIVGELELDQLLTSRESVNKKLEVILDEATASVDADNERAIQEAISELCKNKTLMVIAHRLKTIKDADKILVISDGQIKEEGNHTDLMEKNGTYAHMVKLQSA